MWKTGIATLARPTVVEEKKQRLEPNLMVDYTTPQPKPSIWQRIKRVLGWQ
jgi:hypothetical protein